MNNPPKAYFIDIDRTLIHPKDKKIHLDNIQTIKTFAKQKVYIILSTGRSIDRVLPI